MESSRDSDATPVHADYRPARGYSWPPFEGGNTAALVHGAYSDRAVAARVAELSPGFRDWLAEHAPWASAEEFGHLVVNYLRASAVVDLLTESIATTAATDGPTRVPLRRYETALTALRGQREALAALGLTPGTRAALAATVASTGATLADLEKQGRAVRAAVEAREGDK